MNRRKFLQFLGIGAPAAVVAAVVAPKIFSNEKVSQGESYQEFSARLGEWHNFHHEGDPEIEKAIKNWHSYPERHTITLGEMAQRRLIPIHENTKRVFFTYNVGKL